MSEQAHDAPIVHTTAEAALILRVKESWLERQAQLRKIPFTMLGGSYRFTDEHLNEIVRLNEKLPLSDVVATGRGRKPRSARAPPQASPYLKLDLSGRGARLNTDRRRYQKWRMQSRAVSSGGRVG